MVPPVSHKIRKHSVWLSSDRCIYWEAEKTLIISDLHFGKTGHFRKAGIPVPQTVYKEDLQRLVAQIQYFQPQQLIVVGDLFHSKMNKELDLFKRWRSDLTDISIKLVKGNHDILHDDWYNETGIEVYSPYLTIGDFTFIHDIEDDSPRTGNYHFSGHIHPGISIRGNGKQSLHFPCFYFTENYCVLPAFSRFTGTYGVNPQKNENVFAI
ncbi:MAG: ligase-associated DNA damage response endonuclease PdeM, partial [Bacteroidetes bacterium]|nr:ligase-associated DNA damage response endonuclease PdeM [Bacteroidota bacterium]